MRLSRVDLWVAGKKRRANGGGNSKFGLIQFAKCPSKVDLPKFRGALKNSKRASDFQSERLCCASTFRFVNEYRSYSQFQRQLNRFSFSGTQSH